VKTFVFWWHWPDWSHRGDGPTFGLRRFQKIHRAAEFVSGFLHKHQNDPPGTWGVTAVHGEEFRNLIDWAQKERW
jgi:hypothetical protein